VFFLNGIASKLSPEALGKVLWASFLAASGCLPLLVGCWLFDAATLLSICSPAGFFLDSSLSDDYKNAYRLLSFS
jgi:hypothetical protein